MKFKHLLVIFLVLGLAVTAWAKNLSVQVQFSFDEEFEAGVSGYKLYYRQDGTDKKIYISTCLDVTARIFDSQLFDIPPGKVTDFYLSALNTDGTEDFSPVFPWRFTGSPLIKAIQKLR